jgi:glutathione-specific gamma-glutamylcyclotransferase
MTSAEQSPPELWVFGYGSLMWNPGFPVTEAVPARLDGHHRDFCVYSVFYRGTPARPGLVLGLDRGGACLGMALRVAPEVARATLLYLRAREQVTGVYRETLCPIILLGQQRRRVEALTFVVERHHPGYAGQMPLPMQAKLIRAARGRAGSNMAYALSTLAHLSGSGLREARLERLVPLLGPHFSHALSRAKISSNADHVSSVGNALASALHRHPPGGIRLRPDQRRRFVHRNPLAARFDLKWPGATE